MLTIDAAKLANGLQNLFRKHEETATSLKENKDAVRKMEYHKGKCHAYSIVLDLLTDDRFWVDAEPIVHAKWIPIEYDSYADGNPVWDKWECEKCGCEHDGEECTLTNYCPDCGAKMDGGKCE